MGSRGSDSADRGLGWLLRAHYDGLAREPLPERWLELIRCLDESERLVPIEAEWVGARTNYEDKYLEQGKEIFRRVLEKRAQ